MPRHPDEPLPTLIYQGRFREALPLAEAASKADPGDALALTTLGQLQRELGQYAAAEEVLLQALAKLGGVSKETPEYARTLSELGGLYQETGRYPSAEKLLRSALTLREKTLGSDHADVASSLYDLAGVLDTLAKFAEAEPLAARALALRERLLGADHLDLARSLIFHAWSCWRKGRLSDARANAERAVAAFRKHAPKHPELSTGLALLSRLALHQAEIDVAARHGEEALAIRQAALGAKHQRYAGALENLAVVRAVQGRHDDAESLIQSAIDLTRSALGDRHPFLADGYASQGYALQARGQPQDAEPPYHRALEIYKAAFGDDHVHVAGCHRDLAEVFAGQSRFDEAEEQFRRALAILERYEDSCLLETLEILQGLARIVAMQNRADEAITLARRAVARARQAVGTAPATADDAAMLASGLDCLARIEHGRGELDAAEPLYREVIACRARSPGEQHPLYADSLRCLAALMLAQGKFADAEELEERAAGILRSALGTNSAEYAQALTGLADVCFQKGDLPRAEGLFTEVVESERQRVGEDHPDHARAVSRLANVYLAMNNVQAALVRYRQVIEILERTHGDEHPEYASALHDLATLYSQVGELQAAEELYQQEREILSESPGEDHPDFAECLHGLGVVCQNQGRADEAEPLLQQAVDICQAALGDNHPRTLRQRHALALCLQARGDFVRARDALQQVRASLSGQVGVGSPLLVPILTDLARLYGSVGDHLAAEGLWQQVLTINTPPGDGDTLPHPQAAQDRINLALALRAQGEWKRAEELVRQAIRVLEQRRGGENHPETAATVGLLASVLQAQDRHDDAERAYTSALDRTRNALGHAHPALVSILTELAGLHAMAGLGRATRTPDDPSIRKAFALYTEAIDIVRRGLGDDHPEHANLLRLVAGLHQALGQLEEAEQVARQRLMMLRRLFGQNAAAQVPALQVVGDLCRQRGRYAEAEAVSRQVLKLVRDSAEQAEEGDDEDATPDAAESTASEVGVALAENNLATILLVQTVSQDRDKQSLKTDPALLEVEDLLERSLGGLAHAVGEDHPAYSGTLSNLVALYATTGRPLQALEYAARLADLDRKLLPQRLTLEGERLRAYACHGIQENYEVYLSLGVPLLATEHADEEAERLFDLVLQRKRFGIDVLAVPPPEPWGAKYPEAADDLDRLWRLDRQIAAKRMAGPSYEGLTVCRDLLAGWLAERDALEERLAAAVPELAQRRRLRAVDTRSVAARLEPGWALVEFVHYRPVADFRLRLAQTPQAAADIKKQGKYVAFVLKAGVAPRVVELGPADAVDPLVRQWRTELEGGDPAAGRAFRQAVWDGIGPLVEGCKGLVVAPDGELFHLPMDVLPVADDAVLLDRFAVRQVLSGRDLLREVKRDAAPNRLVVADPAEGGGAEGRGRIAGLWQAVKRALGGPTATRSIADVLRVTPATGPGVIAGLPADIVHVAAPTFYQADQGPRDVVNWENPLLLSGVRLDGANVLSSLHITRLDLWRTRVVVLGNSDSPAQQPGLWSKVSGVLSACVQAGAQNVLLRLWRPTTPTDPTGEFLLTFYRHLLDGSDVGQAFREARREMRTKYRSPTAWGGWVCLHEVSGNPEMGHGPSAHG